MIHSEEVVAARAGWYDHNRILLVSLRYLLRFGIYAALLGAGIGAGIGWLLLHDTYRLDATVRLAAQAQVVHVDLQVAPYKAPEFRPEEVIAWFRSQAVFERLYPLSGRRDGVERLQRMFDVSYSRDAYLFQVVVDGADSAEQAARLLQVYTQLVIKDAGRYGEQRVRQDEDFYGKRLAEARRELETAQERLAAFARTNGFLDLAEEKHARRQRLQSTELRLSEITAQQAASVTRLETIASMLARTSATLAVPLPPAPTPPAAITPPRDPRLEALEDQVRRLATTYAEGNPLLVAAREELALAQRDADARAASAAAAAPVATAAPAARYQEVRNPTAATLEADRVQHELVLPEIEREVERRRAAFDQAAAAQRDMPRLEGEHRRLSEEIARAEGQARRMAARLEEVKIASGLSGNQLQSADLPDAQYAERRPRWLKTVLAGLGGAVLAALFAAGGAVIAAALSRSLRSPTDYRAVLGSRMVEALPVPLPEIVEHRLWLQRTAEHLTNAGRVGLVLVPSDDYAGCTAMARALAMQIARAGLRTVLVADAGLLGIPPRKGLSHILDQEATLDACLHELAPRVQLLPVGDLARLLDQAAGGGVEQLIGTVITGCDFLLVALPSHELPILRRLAVAVGSLALVVRADQGLSRERARGLERLPARIELVLLVP